MDERQQKLLHYIVESYIKTAEPVGSLRVVKGKYLDLSPATIRNEMGILEEDGYIYQPHTSAGRIPTQKAFEYYINHIVRPAPLSAAEEKRLHGLVTEGGVREAARYTAAECQAAAIIMHSRNDFYYTGFSHLFNQPEFTNAESLQLMSAVIDKLEMVLPAIYDEIGDTIHFYIGQKALFSNECSGMFIAKQKNKKVLFGLLSPLRTNYQRSASLLQATAQLL